MTNDLQIKIANQTWEFDAIFRLNHQTFSDELKQHAQNSSGLLVDKFHSENQYIICLNKSEIVGMLALRDVRPFSLDHKLENLDDYLPPHKQLCEIRLLTVKPQYRRSKIFYFLFREMFNLFIKKQYDYAVISGILSQQKLYRSLGFVPFGPIVGNTLKFQPMYSTTEFFFKSRHNTETLNQPNKIINLLPGPVDIKEVISKEYLMIPDSHRSDTFLLNYKKTCDQLSKFTKAGNCQIFTGSATLANEIILAHFSALQLKGLILSNGEFGNRLIHQAHCQRINFTKYIVENGSIFDTRKIQEILSSDSEIKWLFFVHSETSTGILNNFSEIISLCRQYDIIALVDCVSTFGIIPIDLSQVYMASASSGKAIGSYSGLSIIFYNNLIPVPEQKIPVYLDICYYIKKEGIPFTLNSNSLSALSQAVNSIDINLKYSKTKEQSVWFINQISNSDIKLEIVNKTENHPAIITIKLPIEIDSSRFGKLLENHNIYINYKSGYLLKHNTIQICLFSDLNENELKYLTDKFKSILLQFFSQHIDTIK